MHASTRPLHLKAQPGNVAAEHLHPGRTRASKRSNANECPGEETSPKYPRNQDNPMEAMIRISVPQGFEKKETRMGGKGSGRKPTPRTTLGDVMRLDVRDLYRVGEIDCHDAAYRHTRLTWTPCPFGGRRPWFHCPKCSRRCAVLYDTVCRQCTGLKYSSQYEDRVTRMRRRSEALRQRLRYPGVIFSLPPERPEHMRHATYEAILDDIQEIELWIAEQTAPEPAELCSRINEMFAARKRLNRRFPRRRSNPMSQRRRW